MTTVSPLSTMYELQYLRAFALTVSVETAIVWLVLRHGYRITAAQIAPLDIVFGGIVASTVTLPHVWFVLPAFIPSRPVYVGVAEGLAIAVEAALLGVLFRSSLSAPQALLLSVVCNGCSYGAGLLLNV